MNFNSNKLPSSSKEIEWYWNRTVSGNISFSAVSIHNTQNDFTQPVDYFDLSSSTADQLAAIGERYSFFDLPVALNEFELQIFKGLDTNTQIGALLSNITHLRETAEVYGLYATFFYKKKATYCAFTICFVDKDFGQEMETAVIEISEDESAFIQPILINEEALDYYSFDDIARLSFWLGNIWLGIQYEMNNPPEETRVIEQRGPNSVNGEECMSSNRIVLVKRVIPVDKNGNLIEYGPTNSGRKYKCPAWRVSGHPRHYKNGKVTYIAPYPKGKERDNPNAFIEKEYRFVADKIDADSQEGSKGP